MTYDKDSYLCHICFISCGMYSVFKSFNYKQDVDRVNYAEAEFEAFIPTVTSINLQTTNVQLRLSFRVTLCLVGSGCVQVNFRYLLLLYLVDKESIET